MNRRSSETKKILKLIKKRIKNEVLELRNSTNEMKNEIEAISSSADKMRERINNWRIGVWK